MAETYAKTSIPGPLPSSGQGLKHFWSDPEVEPKQQHRFLALFPVYMPGPKVHMNAMRGNSQYLANLIRGNIFDEDTAVVQRERKRRLLNMMVEMIDPSQVYRYTTTIDDPTAGMSEAALAHLAAHGITSAPAEKTARFTLKRPHQSVLDLALTEEEAGPPGDAALMVMLGGVQATQIGRFTSRVLGVDEGIPLDILKKALYTEQTLQSYSRAWAHTKEATLNEVMRTRISPYVVTSFTPPSYGVNLTTNPMAGTTIIYTDDRKSSTKMDSAQLVLVSTLQDDIQFSLNFLWHHATIGGGGASAYVKPYLFPENIRDEKLIGPQKNLIIAEMSAGYKTGFESIGNTSRDATVPGGEEPLLVFPRISDLGILAPVDRDGNMHKGTIVGYHILHDPYISAVSTTPFTYEGQELVKTTITLSMSDDAPGFYSYQTFIDETGDTRFPSKKKIINYSNEVGVKEPLIDALNAGVSEYPNFSNKDGGVNQKRVKIEAEMKMMAEEQLLEREATIDKALASGDKHKMNELVTKGISTIQAEEEAAEQRRREEEERRREEERRAQADRDQRQRDHDYRFEGHEEDWHRLEGDDLALMADDEPGSDTTNQQIQEYIDDNTTDYGRGSYSTVAEREAWEAREQAYQESMQTPLPYSAHPPEAPLPDDYFDTVSEPGMPGGSDFTTPAHEMQSPPHPVPGGGYSNDPPSSNPQGSSTGQSDSTAWDPDQYEEGQEEVDDIDWDSSPGGGNSGPE